MYGVSSFFLCFFFSFQTLRRTQNGARWGIPFLLLALRRLSMGGVDGESLVVASSPELCPSEEYIESPSISLLKVWVFCIFFGVEDSSDSDPTEYGSLLCFILSVNVRSGSPRFMPPSYKRKCNYAFSSQYTIKNRGAENRAQSHRTEQRDPNIIQTRNLPRPRFQDYTIYFSLWWVN